MSEEEKKENTSENNEEVAAAATPVEVPVEKAEETTETPQVEEEPVVAEVVSIPELRAGMTIRLHQKIKEGDKERIQVFQGIIIALRGKTPETKTMTVQKNSFGVIVEKIYPLASPLIEKIEVVKKAKTRRAKLYFLKHGYNKKLKETLVKS